MKNKSIYLILISIVVLLLYFPASAQDDDKLSLHLSRDFGYSSGTGKIQGTFSMKVTGPDNLMRVAFYIDDQPIGEVNEEPFRLRFITDDYGAGIHSLYAVGYTGDNRELKSNVIRAEFVSAEEGWQAGLKILGPLLAIVAGVLIFSFILMFITGKKTKNLPPGTLRNYGVVGGAICPRCDRPYPRHVWAPNLLVGKLERCPFCGKWAVVAAKPLAELRAAEAAEMGSEYVETPSAEDDEDRLRKELENSRFQDL